MTSVTPCQ